MSSTTPTPRLQEHDLDPDRPHAPDYDPRSRSFSLSTSSSPAPSPSPSDSPVDAQHEEGEGNPRLAPPRPFFFAADNNNNPSDTAISTSPSPSPSEAETDVDAEPNLTTTVVSELETVDPQAQQQTETEVLSEPPTEHKDTDTETDNQADMTSSNAAYSPLDTSPPPLTIAAASPADSSTPPNPPPKSPTTQVQQPKPLPSRPPPSSFAYTYAAFPFQAYPGNPDPGLSIPGFTSRRRASLDSYNGGVLGGGNEREREREREQEREDLRSGSLNDLRKPFAPFMAGGENNTSSSTSLPRSSSSNSLYKQSAAANLVNGGQGQVQAGHNPIPRNASTHSFRAPFLSPSSRPTSSLWAPPTYTTNSPNPNHQPPNPNLNGNHTSPNGSTTALGIHTHAQTLAKSKPPLPSTLLRAPIPISEKPWLTTGTAHQRHDGTRTTLSYYLTLLLILLGAIAAAIQCYTGLTSVNAPIPANRLCMVMDEDFPADGSGGGVLDSGNWNVDVELSGYGNGEFEMTTSNPGNIFVKNGQLYIMPTLTSDTVQNVLNGGSFTLDGCTSGNSSDGVQSISPGSGNKANGGEGASCSVTSNDALGTVINPVQSARINTRGKKSIQFGKVEVRAKLPRGDWLWPQIILLPSSPSPYGAWPVSGELDLLLARGNNPSTYPAQGNSFVRSSLSFGPLPAIASASLYRTIFGFLGIKHPGTGQQAGYTEGFHTYTMEWTEEFIRFSVDKPTRAVLEVSTRARKPQFGFGAKAVNTRSYWNQAGFPQVAKGVGGGPAPNVNPNTGAGADTGAGAGATGTGTGNGTGNGTDTSGNSTSSTNTTTTSTNSTFPRALTALSFPVITNTTSRTNSSSSSASPSHAPSSNPNTNPNSGNPADAITPITNPYTSIPSSTPAAPFDRPFYLILNLAVGGTSGWFPDGVGGKMWFDGSGTAMRDFARAQDTWYKTWPASEEDRALRIDYIKMWELC